LIDIVNPQGVDETRGFQVLETWGSVVRLSALALALVFFASPVPADAQPPGKAPRVGFLGLPGELASSRWRDGFIRGLRDLGYVPGESIIVDFRGSTTTDELHQGLNEFIRLKVDIIFVGPPALAMAAKQAPRGIPIVCGTCGDPVENGLAESLARPGGNVTGLASLSAELIGKRMALMQELLPGASRLAVFLYPANPGTRATLSPIGAASLTLGIKMHRVDIRGVGDFENAFGSAARGGAGAVVLQDDPLTFSARRQIAALALKHRLPVSTGIAELAEAGALIAYGPDRVDMYRRAAGLVVKILKGAKPADLPFEQATKLDLILNLKNAKALGLTIPQSFFLRADRVIE
ncbi:MAG: ABC transporter substrate-binding protein, partial [bacterium]